MSSKYHIAIPEVLYETLRKYAEVRETTIESTLKMVLMLGFAVLEIEQSPDAELLVRQGEEARIITANNQERYGDAL